MDKFNQIMEKFRGKEAYSALGVSLFLATLLDNLEGEMFYWTLGAVCYLCTIAVISRLVSKKFIEEKGEE